MCKLTYALALAVMTAGIAAATSAKSVVTVDPADFVRDVTNPWYPLPRGSQAVFRGRQSGKPTRDVMTVRRGTKTILGVPCVVVTDYLYVDGRLRERTRDWFAQDTKGSVWYFGEDTAELDATGHVTSREGSWQAGVDGAEAGIVMPGRPRVGQSFRQEFYKGHAEDHFKIVSISAQVSTPFVSGSHAMKTLEWSPLEPGVREHKYYVRGIGLVAVPADDQVLVSFKAVAATRTAAPRSGRGARHAARDRTRRRARRRARRGAR
jgi:hypothetical protein